MLALPSKAPALLTAFKTTPRTTRAETLPRRLPRQERSDKRRRARGALPWARPSQTGVQGHSVEDPPRDLHAGNGKRRPGHIHPLVKSATIARCANERLCREPRLHALHATSTMMTAERRPGQKHHLATLAKTTSSQERQ